MTSGKMLEHPRVLMVIPQVIWWRELWLETRAQEGEGSEVALGYDWNACLQEQGRRDTDAPLPASLGDEAAAIRDHLAPARRTHVRENRKFGTSLLREGEHGPSPVDHLLGQIATVLIEDLCAPRDHVEAIPSVNIRHGARCAQRVLFGAERQYA